MELNYTPAISSFAYILYLGNNYSITIHLNKYQI